MKTFLYLILTLILISKSTPIFAQTEHIKFNHLYIVLDDKTYEAISAGQEFFKEFSTIEESSVEIENDSWTGKYLNGKYGYLEFFKTSSFEDAEIGQFGLALMPDKIGTLENLAENWRLKKDTIDLKTQNYVNNGVSYPWYTSLQIAQKDTVNMRIWLMENQKEIFKNVGFTENELNNSIDYFEFLKKIEESQNPNQNYVFDKLFEKINSIHLEINSKELDYIQETLESFGFIKKGNQFIGQDFSVTYTLSTQPKGKIKNIEFKLTRSIPSKTHLLNSLKIETHANSAIFEFIWN